MKVDRLSNRNDITTTSRIDYFDIARGLGMIAVIWGHIMLSGWSYILAYAFDIPLFFFLSGVMFKKEKYPTLKTFFIKKCKTLLLPYLIYSVLTWIAWIFYLILAGNLGDTDIWSALLQTFIAQGSSKFLVHNPPLWFVTCLFLVSFVYYFLSKCNDFINLAICAVMAGIGHWMLHTNIGFDFTLLPWNIEVVMSAMLFYSAGNLFAKRFGTDYFAKQCENKKALSMLVMVLCFAVFIVGALWNGPITLGSNCLGKNTVVLYIVGFISIIAMMLLCAFADRLRRNGVVDFCVSKICWIGHYSFDFMAIHVPVRMFCKAVIVRLFVNTSEVDVGHHFGYNVLIFWATFLVTAVAVAIVNKIKSALKRCKKQKAV